MLFIEQFLETSLAERGIAQNTLLSYKRDLLDFSNYLTKCDKDEFNLAAVDIDAYIRFLSENNISPRSIGRKISTLKSYYNFLISENHISYNPVLIIDLPKYYNKLPDILSVDEIAKLLEYCDKDESYEGIRFSAMIHLAYASGLRVSELVSIKLFEITVNNATQIRKSFSIIGKGSKERIVVINDKAKKSLEDYLKIRENFCIGKSARARNFFFPSASSTGHMTRQNFALLLKKYTLEAGLDPEVVSPHVLRHSFASHLLEGGANLRIIQELLGHSDIGTTQIYTRVQTHRLKKVLKDFHPLEQE